MTAALGNTAQGTPFATGVDAFVYPQFLGIPLRAPTTQDIYNPGTRWQDNSVNPAVQYYTIGAGIWYELPNTSFGVSSVTGTAGQITASPTVGPVVLSIPAAFVAPGSIASTTTLTGGTGITATTGNITASAGNVSASGTVTGGTGVIATTGNLTATAGNLALNGATSKVNINAGTAASASVGTTAALTGGAIIVSTTAITASSLVFFSTNTLGTVTVPQAYRVSARTAGVSFTIQSQNATDTSTVNYWIIN
jgi:hypothetical protein